MDRAIPAGVMLSGIIPGTTNLSYQAGFTLLRDAAYSYTSGVETLDWDHIHWDDGLSLVTDVSTIDVPDGARYALLSVELGRATVGATTIQAGFRIDETTIVARNVDHNGDHNKINCHHWVRVASGEDISVFMTAGSGTNIDQGSWFSGRFYS